MPLFFLFLLFFSAVGPASGVSLSISEMADYLREHHPLLAAARLHIEEAQGRHLGSGRLTNPEVGLGVASDRRFREGAVELSLEQRFPITSRLRLEKAVSLQQIAVAQWEVREMERELVATAQELAIRWLALNEQVQVRERQVALLERWRSASEKQAAQGELSSIDVGQIALERSRLALEARSLQREQLTLLGQLAPALGLPPGQPLIVTGKLPAVALPPRRAPWQARPDYQRTLAQQKQARAEIALAKSRRWEDVTTAVMWEAERELDEGGSTETNRFLGVRVSLPLPLWNRNQGQIAEKRAAERRAVLQTQARQEAIEHEIAASYATMAASARLVSESREQLLPLAREQVTRLETAFRQGQASLFDLLRAQETQLQLEAATLDHLRDFHLARVRYQATLAHPVSPKKPKSARP